MACFIVSVFALFMTFSLVYNIKTNRWEAVGTNYWELGDNSLENAFYGMFYRARGIRIKKDVPSSSLD